MIRAIRTAIIGMSLAGFILVGLTIGITMKSYMNNQIEKNNEMLVDLLLPQIQHYFVHPEGIALGLKDLVDQSVETGESVPLSKLLNTLSTTYVRRVEKLDASGIIRDVYPENDNLLGLDTSGRKYDFEPGTDRIYRSATFVDPISRGATMAFIVETSDKGQLVIYPDLSEVQGFLNGVRLSEHSQLGIVDMTGVYVAHSDEVYALDRYVDPTYHEWVASPRRDMGVRTIDGEQYNVTVEAINDTGWALFIYQSIKDLNSGWIWFVKWTGIISLMIIPALYLMSAYINRRISGDIRVLNDAVVMLESGSEQTQAVNLKYKETGVVFKTLQETGGELRKRENEIKALNRGLEKRVQERTLDLEAVNQELISTIEDLQETQNRLVESRKMAEIGRVVSGVAHEMNTPLGNALTISSYIQEEFIKTSARLLNGKMSKNEAKEWFESIGTSLELQIKAISKSAFLVQEFKKLDSNQPIAKDWFNLSDILGVISETFKERFECENCKLHIAVYNEQIHTDAAILRDIVELLIDNIIVHAYDTEDTKDVFIEGRFEQDAYLVSVWDTGRGIDKENPLCAFNAFESNRREYGNMGLGLFIVGNYVRNLLGGDVECISGMNAGTRIVMRLDQPKGKNEQFE